MKQIKWIKKIINSIKISTKESIIQTNRLAKITNKIKPSLTTDELFDILPNQIFYNGYDYSLSISLFGDNYDIDYKGYWDGKRKFLTRQFDDINIMPNTKTIREALIKMFIYLNEKGLM